MLILIFIGPLLAVIVAGIAWCLAWGDRRWLDDDEPAYVIQPAVVGWSASREALPPEQEAQLKEVVDRMFS